MFSEFSHDNYVFDIILLLSVVMIFFSFRKKKCLIRNKRVPGVNNIYFSKRQQNNIWQTCKERSFFFLSEYHLPHTMGIIINFDSLFFSSRLHHKYSLKQKKNCLPESEKNWFVDSFLKIYSWKLKLNSHKITINCFLFINECLETGGDLLINTVKLSIIWCKVVKPIIYRSNISPRVIVR